MRQETRRNSPNVQAIDLVGILAAPPVVQAYADYRRTVENLQVGKIGAFVRVFHKPLPVRATSYLPLLLSEVFELADNYAIIRQVGFAQHCINHFAHLVDFLADEPQTSAPEAVHVTSLLLGRAVNMYGTLHTRADLFWDHWERYGHEASNAERSLWRHRDVLAAYSTGDFAALADKSALLKMTAAIFASISARWDRLTVVEAAMSRSFLALQLIDDLVDCEHDCQAGIYTYPLWLLHARGHSMEPSTVSSSIVSSGVATQVLALALDNACASSVLLREVNGLRFASCLDHLCSSLRDVQDSISTDCAIGPENPMPSVADIREYLRRHLDSRFCH